MLRRPDRPRRRRPSRGAGGIDAIEARVKALAALLRREVGNSSAPACTATTTSPRWSVSFGRWRARPSRYDPGRSSGDPACARYGTAGVAVRPTPPADKSSSLQRSSPNDVGTACDELFSHPIISPVDMFETSDDGLPVSRESSDHERTGATNIHAHHRSPAKFGHAAHQCGPAENLDVRAQFS